MVHDYKKIDEGQDFDEWYDKYNDVYQLDKRISYLESIIEDLHLEKKHACPICGESFIEFMPFGSLLYKREQCQYCGSLSRQRSLYLIMEWESYILNETRNIKILHFAPEPALYQLFDEEENVDYVPVDLNKDSFKRELYFFASGKTSKYYKNYNNYIKESINVENIPYEDNTFDYVIISHVLEHVSHDKQAMGEIYRVLKSGGVAFIAVPIGGEKTNEDEKINTPDLRLRGFTIIL